MSAYNIRGQHLSLIARHFAKHSIRGGMGIVYLLFTLFTGLMIAAPFCSAVESIQKGVDGYGEEMPTPTTRPTDRVAGAGRNDASDARTKALLDELDKRYVTKAVKFVLDADDVQSDYLVMQKPAVVSAILVCLLFAIPFLVSFGSFNQTSGDIGSKGLRYLLTRTERANIFLGRFIGTFLYTMVVLLALLATVGVYVVLKIHIYPAGDVLTWIISGYVALAILALPYVAMCAWISASVDSPFLSLLISQLIIGLLPLVVYLASTFSEVSRPGWGEKIHYLDYSTPWPLKGLLLHPNFGYFLGATVAMVGFTGIFLVLGLRKFQTRDL